RVVGVRRHILTGSGEDDAPAVEFRVHRAITQGFSSCRRRRLSGLLFVVAAWSCIAVFGAGGLSIADLNLIARAQQQQIRRGLMLGVGDLREPRRFATKVLVARTCGPRLLVAFLR